MRPDLKPISKHMLPRRRKSVSKKRQVRSWFRWLFLPLIVPAVILCAGWGLWHINAGQWLTQKATDAGVHLLQKIGLELSIIEIHPLKYTSEDVILKAMDVQHGQSLFQIDPQVIRERVEGLPWVWSAVIERQLPHKLSVHVSEREPMAIWHQNKEMFLVDKEGVTLSNKVPDIFKGLPSIAGQDAAKNAPPLFQALERFQAIRALVKTAVCVGKRRWNLLLISGTQVYLPENGLEEALLKLNDLADRKLLDTLIVKIVDLRLEGRIVLKMTPEASLKLQTKGIAKET